MKKTKVLFLCTHNSARSQMAEGLLRHFYGGKYEVFSAGSSPTQVHPLAIEVMYEIGIDISRQTSKSIEEFRSKDIDVVASVCKSSARVVCPFCSSPLIGGRPEIIDATLPGAKHYVHFGFDDPSEVDGSDEQKLAAFRRTRDAIKEWILDYFAELKTEGSGGSA
jgi:arsenate reductase